MFLAYSDGFRFGHRLQVGHFIYSVKLVLSENKNINMKYNNTKISVVNTVTLQSYTTRLFLHNVRVLAAKTMYVTGNVFTLIRRPLRMSKMRNVRPIFIYTDSESRYTQCQYCRVNSFIKSYSQEVYGIFEKKVR